MNSNRSTAVPLTPLLYSLLRLALDQGLPSGPFDHAIARVESCYCRH
jgi:hypothetical protein